MLLAVDIGNTNIDFALISKNGKIMRKVSIPTSKPKKWKPSYPKKKVTSIVVVSVAPKILKKVKSKLKKQYKNARISIVGSDVKVPLKCMYNKKQIGQDRLITAFAASTIYGLPILTIDFGTAVTFDAVSKKSVYLGGLILPGIKMSLESLSERAAMLPMTHLKKTNSFIARDTRSSIRNGMIYGYSAICDGLIGIFRKKIGKNIKVVATGGDASLIGKYTSSVKKVDSNLSLKGIYLLTKIKNKKRLLKK